MKSLHLGILIACNLVLGTDLPSGFQEPGLIYSLKEGRVLFETPTNTFQELVQVSKAYFNNVSVENYVALITNHRKYAFLFKDGSPRIVNAFTVGVNNEKTEYDYQLLVEVDGPFGSVYEVKPAGKQGLVEKAGETVIDNNLTNYKEKLSVANETTRVIPYETGVLIEHRLHIVLKEQTTTSVAMKKQLSILFARFVPAFKKELGD